MVPTGSPFDDLTVVLERVAVLDPAAVPEEWLLRGLEHIFDAVTRLQACSARWLLAADTRDTTVTECGRAIRSWLVEEQLVNPGEASRRLRLARALPGFPATEAAFTTAAITESHVTVILAALLQVPAVFRDAVEAALLELAAEQPPFLVARAVDQILTSLGVETSADEAAARRYARRGVSLDETFGGTGSLAGTLTPEVLALLRRALDAATGPVGSEDERTAAQRRHDALGDIAGHYLRHAELPADGGDRPRVVVTIPLDTVLDQLSAQWGRLESGAPVAPETARRLACDAELIPAVLGAKGEVLDLGRASRTFSTAIRRAARLRDGGRCAFPRCSRRIAECHHLVWWSAGGRTSLDNAVWLCTFHHWLAHEGGWTIRRNRNGSYTWTHPSGTETTGPPPRHPQAA